MHKEDLMSAHSYCIRNREALEKDTLCGCFSCRKIFDPKKITDYIREKDGGVTAQCPYCGIDAVIGESAGYPISEEFLFEMHKYWFKNVR